MRQHGISGRIKFFGEPAEKMCGSKPVHAAHGYYDDLEAAIDPLHLTAARTIACALLDLVTDAAAFERCRTELRERSGGGTAWLAPLLPADFTAPIDFRWPEYVEGPRGTEWTIPNQIAG